MEMRLLRQALGAVLFAGLMFWVLRPFWQNGYWGDDTLNSLVVGEVGRRQASFWDFYREIEGNWRHGAGRLFPLGLMATYAGHDVFAKLEFFRFYQALWVVLNVALFRWLLWRAGSGRHATFFVCLTLPLFFQVRRNYDAIGSYGALMQLTTTWVCLACLPLVKAPRSNARLGFALIFSAAMAGLAFTTYEASLVFLPLFLYLAWRTRLRWRALIPQVVVAVVYLGAVLYFRHYAAASYPGIQPGSPAGFIETYLKLVTALLPLISFFGFVHRDHAFIAHFADAWYEPETWWVFWVWAGLMTYVLRKAVTEGIRFSHTALLIAAWLFFASPLLIAFSGKYQAELDWGVGYLPIYLAAFGAATFLGHFLANSRQARGALAVVLAALVALTHSLNLKAAARLDDGHLYPRIALETALDQGLLSDLPERARVVSNVREEWLNAAFLFQHTGRHLSLWADRPDTSYDGDSPVSGTDVFFLRLAGLGDEGWQISVFRVLRGEKLETPPAWDRLEARELDLYHEYRLSDIPPANGHFTRLPARTGAARLLRDFEHPDFPRAQYRMEIVR